MRDGKDKNLEVEVKFLAPELGVIRKRLQEEGAKLIRPRQFERNVIFDTDEETLRSAEQLLRLRKDDRVRLTFKGAAAEAATSEAKVREELEIEVDDFGITSQILERLGFSARREYEKYRETFQVGDVEVVLDELPFGDFVELEGEEGAIRAVADRLELAWSRRILINYLGLMDRLVARHALSFDDLTFATFEGVEVTVEDLFSAS